MANGFMVDEITDEIEWVRTENKYYETEYIPAQYFDAADADEYETIEKIKGFGARIQAPGYLDSTEWSVFDTVEAAQAYLHETYHDDHHEIGCPTCDEELETCKDEPCPTCLEDCVVVSYVTGD